MVTLEHHTYADTSAGGYSHIYAQTTATTVSNVAADGHARLADAQTDADTGTSYDDAEAAPLANQHAATHSDTGAHTGMSSDQRPFGACC